MSDEQGEPPIEVLARFDRAGEVKEAPRGTLHVDGREPIAFAGWLDLMAIVEQLLAEADALPLRFRGDDRQ